MMMMMVVVVIRRNIGALTVNESIGRSKANVPRVRQGVGEGAGFLGCNAHCTAPEIS